MGGVPCTIIIIGGGRAAGEVQGLASSVAYNGDRIPAELLAELDSFMERVKKEARELNEKVKAATGYHP